MCWGAGSALCELFPYHKIYGGTLHFFPPQSFQKAFSLYTLPGAVQWCCGRGRATEDEPVYCHGRRGNVDNACLFARLCVGEGAPWLRGVPARGKRLETRRVGKNVNSASRKLRNPGRATARHTHVVPHERCACQQYRGRRGLVTWHVLKFFR